MSCAILTCRRSARTGWEGGRSGRGRWSVAHVAEVTRRTRDTHTSRASAQHHDEGVDRAEPPQAIDPDVLRHKPAGVPPSVPDVDRDVVALVVRPIVVLQS